ncbi:LysR family transcriptional regulator [Blautia liquoris]|uniref:LysR family transcriptional regulator n=1 Tax=Blautia liquoris TaxID=2779518 RepID=A0A7M2RGV4_9FIRM|nr:LysR family transcriptional regulator [Blautia liquoris]QOV19368.1 LysR family transcriptional regulator [Blautia liquoris]
MKLNIMREFVRLSATRNYSKTADELYIAQSALSRHMSALEDELNVKLIDRTRNSFELTPMGKIVLEDFKKILKNYEDLLDKIAKQTEIENGELHLGFLYYDMNYYVAKIRHIFHKKYPKIKLILHSYQPMQLEADLLEGKLDVALIYGMSGCCHRDIEYIPFLKIPYSLIYCNNHRFASRKDIRISDLDGERLLCPEAPFELNHVGDMLEKMFAEGGAHTFKKIQIHNYDEVPWLMKENDAIYISPMVNNQAYGSDTKYRFLLPELYHTDVSAVWLSKNTNAAIHLLCSAIKVCYP